ncbi:MAG: hypothetical protein KDC34_07490 [Saprospiraceae bacterium]|nr:hypothetical protein [Saprospiraceae bacterium]
MNQFKQLVPLLLVSIFLLLGCAKSQLRYAKVMEGTWNIAEETIILINPDGKTELVSQATDVGTLLLEEPILGDGIFLDYTIVLNNNPYTWVKLPFKTDDERKRVFFYNFYCGDVFNCDMSATIEVDKKDEQMWSFFRQDTATSGSGTAHRKTTWTLRRVE